MRRMRMGMARYGGWMLAAVTLAVVAMQPFRLAVAQESRDGRPVVTERDRRVDSFFRGSLIHTGRIPPTGEEVVDLLDPGTAGPGLDPIVDVPGPDTGDTADVTDTADTVDTSDTSDVAGDTADTADIGGDGADVADTADTAETADTSDVGADVAGDDGTDTSEDCDPPREPPDHPPHRDDHRYRDR